MILFKNGMFEWTAEGSGSATRGVAATFAEARLCELEGEMRKQTQNYLRQRYPNGFPEIPGKDLDDIVQEAIIAVWQWMERTPEAAEKNAAYIIRRNVLYARRGIYRTWRTAQNRFDSNALLYDSGNDAFEFDPLDPQTMDDRFLTEGVFVEEVTESLPRESHKVIVRMLADGYTHREIGKSLGVTYKAVQGQIGTIRNHIAI